jgi:hypothetical protein
MPTRDLSYANVTAAGASQTEHVSYAAVTQAVSQRDKLIFLKLNWEASAAACLVGDNIRELNEIRQELKKKLDAFLLALTELQNLPAKNLTEEQFKKRIAICQESVNTIDKLKKALADIDREADYLNDYREELQDKFRQTISKHLKKIDELQEEKLEIIFTFLRQQGLNPEASPSLKHDLKKALNDPHVQEMYLRAAGEPQRKGLLKKLKGWFK